MGTYPLDGAGPEQISAQGRVVFLREVVKAEGGGEMGISSAGGSDGGGGL